MPFKLRTDISGFLPDSDKLIAQLGSADHFFDIGEAVGPILIIASSKRGGFFLAACLIQESRATSAAARLGRGLCPPGISRSRAASAGLLWRLRTAFASAAVAGIVGCLLRLASLARRLPATGLLTRTGLLA